MQQQRRKSCSGPTALQAMRKQNCKTFLFRPEEVYLNIKASVSKCPPAEKDDNDYVSVIPRRKRCTPRPRNTTHKKFNAPLDWAHMTPSEVLRRYNCKTFDFSQRETFPNILPPSSTCNEMKAAQRVGRVVAENCGRFFNMENDDIVELWKQSPDKNTLGFYGIDTESQQEDAEAFNKLVSKCLKMVKKTTDVKPPKIQPTAVSKKPKQITEDPCDGLVLNHVLLARKVYTMPTVKKKISGNNALSVLHCPRRRKNMPPFVETPCDRSANLNEVHDMEKSVSKGNRRQRKKQKYCHLKCGIAKNDCTYLEWLKYKHESRPYDLAFTEEMNRVQVATEPEPKNYEELYEQLMECFENNQLDPMCEAYKACCLKKKYDQEDGGKGKGGKGGTGEGMDGDEKGDGGVGGDDKPGRGDHGIDKTGKGDAGKDKPGIGDDGKPGKGDDGKDKTGKGDHDKDKHGKGDDDKNKFGDGDGDGDNKDKTGNVDGGQGDSGKDKPGKDDSGKDKPGKGDGGKKKPGKGDKDKPGKGDAGKGKPGKGDDDKDKSGKGDDDKDKPFKDKPGKGDDEKDKPGKGDKDKDKGKDKPGIGDDGKDKFGKGGGDKDKAGKGDDGKDKSGKGDGDKDKSGKGDAGKDKPGIGDDGKDKSGKGGADTDKPGKGGDGKDKSGKGADGKDKSGKGDGENDKTGKDNEVKNKSGDGDGDGDGKNIDGDGGNAQEEEENKIKSGDDDKTEKNNKGKPPKKKKKGTKPKPADEVRHSIEEKPLEDCPCRICSFRKRSADNLLIRKLKEEDKRRQLRDYYAQMCYRQMDNKQRLRHSAPLRQCDPIECDVCFCCNPKLSEYSDCLNVMNELQKELPCTHPVKNELMNILENLKERICCRFCECVQ